MTVALGNHVDLLTGFPFKSSRYTENLDDVLLLRGDNIAQGWLRWDGAKRWPKRKLKDFTPFELQSGDVILAMDRPWIENGLKWAWVPERHDKMLLVQRVARMRGINGLRTDYLRYLIGSPTFTNYVLSITTGVNVPHISARDIKAFQFDLPSIEVQCRITGILSAYDDLILVNTRRIAILEEMCRAMYRVWLERNISFPIGVMGDLCELTKDDFIISDHSELPLLDLSRIPSKSLALNQTGHASELTTSRIVFQAGDTLFGSIRPYLHKVVIAPFSGVTNVSVLVLRPRSKEYRVMLAIVASSVDTIRWADQHSSGTKMPVIKWEVLKSMPVPVPDAEIMERFEDLTGPIIDEICVLSLTNANLQTARDFLLPKLIAGEIDVSVAEQKAERTVKRAAAE